MFLGLLFSGAHAYTLMPCDGITVVDAVPSAAAEGVPLDARPAAVFGPGGCGPGVGLVATLTTEAGEEVPTTLGEGSDDPDATWLVELFPAEPLLPATAYVLETISRDGLPRSSGFTTGSGTVAGLDGEPTLAVEGASWASRDRQVSVDIRVDAAADPDGLSVVQVRDADVDRGLQTFRVPDAGTVTTTVTWAGSPKPAEVCPQVRQIDGAGVATEWSEPTCVAVGCSTSGGAASLAGALLALGAALFRRERR